MSKQRILGLVFFLFVNRAAAQESQQTTIGGVFLEAGTDLPSYRLNTFETLVLKYNGTNSARLNTPLSGLSPGAGKVVGIGGFLEQEGWGMFELNFTQGFSREVQTKAVFKNGDAREFTIRYRPSEVNFALLFGGPRVYLGFTSGLQTQKATLYSGFRYSNGPLSYGQDQPMNGIFEFRQNRVMNVGARLDIRLFKALRISARADYNGIDLTTEKPDENPSLVPHRDEMMAKASGGIVYRDGYTRYTLMEENPLDGQGYVPARSGEDGSGKPIARAFKGWQYTATLKFTLKSWTFN